MNPTIRIPVQLPPEVREGWLQLIAYVPAEATEPITDLAIVIVSHIPEPKEDRHVAS